MIPVPSSGTVYGLRGAGGTINNRWLNSVFAGPTYQWREVAYPASMAGNSISDGVTEVNRLARSTPGPIIWLGHSQGCQVLTDFIRQHNTDPAVPDDMVYVMTGNPVRNPTGQLIGAPVVGPLGSKGVATPADSRWPVIDVARRGDPFAIKRNAWWLFFADWYGKFFIHPFYTGVDMFDPANVVEQNGSITLVTTA